MSMFSYVMYEVSESKEFNMQLIENDLSKRSTKKALMRN